MFDSDMSSFIQQHIKSTIFFLCHVFAATVISPQLSIYNIMAGNQVPPAGMNVKL